MIERRVLYLGRVCAKPLALIVQGAHERAADLLHGERLELKDAAAGYDRGRHRGVRVLRRRADEHDGALLDRGEQGVRLRLVEAVALVQHEVGASAEHLQVVARLVDRLFDVRNARIDGVELDKRRVGARRNDVGERRLARAGRPPEDAAAQPIERDGAPQKAALRDEVLLPHELIHGVGAHALRERLRFFFVIVEIKQIHYLMSSPIFPTFALPSSYPFS